MLSRRCRHSRRIRQRQDRRLEAFLSPYKLEAPLAVPSAYITPATCSTFLLPLLPCVAPPTVASCGFV
ncbi:hypothetical protein E2C01_027065 [Portunus trituberculatus]|uniref:Uncharacterized protein n=1 Tax=Portunus trituberculatus TaxID=210409 RepID=A0A5B7EKJ8_PORTR|nr:hypothetical protein [Portunus trituberculatus]